VVQNGVKAAQPVRSERFSFVSFGPASSAGLFFGAAVTLWTRRGADQRRDLDQRPGTLSKDGPNKTMPLPGSINLKTR
jgi:hypothetical protein